MLVQGGLVQVEVVDNTLTPVGIKKKTDETVVKKKTPYETDDAKKHATEHATEVTRATTCLI